MFKRSLPLPTPPTESFFLWGPRQTGKSTLLRKLYPHAQWVDLLHTDLFLRYTQRPYLLREEVLARPQTSLVVIDEVQKVPMLLDEVHWLIENHGMAFALCGSSARKIRRGHANLLGGRAIRYELFGLVYPELGSAWDLTRALNHGLLPRHYLSPQPARLVTAYVNDYLKEEVAAESLVRNLGGFSTFLGVAALSDTEPLNYTNIARECGVSSPTVKAHYQILEDTLLGRFLPAYVKRAQRRVVHAPKFYFADVGVVNQLARRGKLLPGSELFGKALESYICHELSAYREYCETPFELTYWRLSSGIEVDFVVNDVAVAIEVKASSRVRSGHLKGLRQIAEEHPQAGRRLLVCLDDQPRRTEDGIDILPVQTFLARLWADELL